MRVFFNKSIVSKRTLEANDQHQDHDKRQKQTVSSESPTSLRESDGFHHKQGITGVLSTAFSSSNKGDWPSYQDSSVFVDGLVVQQYPDLLPERLADLSMDNSETVVWKKHEKLKHNELSQDALICTLQHLDLKSLISCAAVCRQWRSAVLDPRAYEKIDVSPFHKTMSEENMTGFLERGNVSVREVLLRGCPQAGSLVSKVLATRCPQLRNIDLSVCPSISQSDLFLIFSSCQYLVKLNISCNSQVNNQLLDYIGRELKFLEDINVSWCKGITSQGIMFLLAPRVREMKRLKEKWKAKFTTKHRHDRAHPKVSKFVFPFVFLSCINSPLLSKQISSNILEEGNMNAQMDCTHSPSTLPIASGDAYDIDPFSLYFPVSHIEHNDIPQFSMLKRLHLGNCPNLTDDIFPSFEGATGLRVLNLHFNDRISDSGLRILLSHCNFITSLTLSGCWRITDRALELITERLYPGQQEHAELFYKHQPTQAYFVKKYFEEIKRPMPTQGLVNFQAAYCRFITDHGVQVLAKTMPTLRRLDLEDCNRISDNAVLAIGQHLFHLKSLILSGCDRITDSGFESIVHGCHCLSTLSLDGCPFVNDKSLSNLMFLDDLQVIDLFDCRGITKQAIKDFKATRREASDTNRVHLTELKFTGFDYFFKVDREAEDKRSLRSPKSKLCFIM